MIHLDERFNFTSINFAKLRAVKREDELNYCEKAAKIGDDAFAALLPQLKVGMTENEARIILETEMLKRGSERAFFLQPLLLPVTVLVCLMV